jgi:selenocysteine lyase/cysteine desulfurase
MGERASFILVPMMIAALEFIAATGPSTVAEHSGALNARIARETKRFGIESLSPENRAAHILGLRLPGSMSRDAARDLFASKGISVSWRGNGIRVSPHVYNTDTDVESLLDAFIHLSRKPCCT